MDTIDIYNIATGAWRTENTAVIHSDQLACYMNGKIIIAGGAYNFEPTSVVEIFGTELGEWLDLMELSTGRRWFSNGNRQAPVIGNKAFFPGGLLGNTLDNPTTTMDIYTDTTSTTFAFFTPVLKNLSIVAFPSPFTETLQVQVDFERPLSGTLEVYDHNGRQVFLQNIDNQQVWNKTIASQNWETGAYLLRCAQRWGWPSAKS